MAWKRWMGLLDVLGTRMREHRESWSQVLKKPNSVFLVQHAGGWRELLTECTQVLTDRFPALLQLQESTASPGDS